MSSRLMGKSRLCVVFHRMYLVLCTVRQLSGCLVEYTPTAIPRPPSNVSLTQILSTSATIQWESDVSDQVIKFEMTIGPPPATITSPNGSLQKNLPKNETYAIFADDNVMLHSYTVTELHPSTEYRAKIVAFNTEGSSNASSVLLFTTLPDVDGRENSLRLVISFGEILVVVFVLSVWFAAIGLFLNKWGKIRISGPGGQRFKHSPKNLDTIKVVKKPKESVIYKTHPKDSLYCRTMDARMKRLERMNTMPNIKVDISPKTKDKGKHKGFFSFRESPKLERNKSVPLIECGMLFDKDKQSGTKYRFEPPPPVIEVEEVVNVPSVGYVVA